MIRSSILLICLSFVIIASSPIATEVLSAKKHTINAVLGDISYIQKFGEKPGAAADDITRITTHLDYVIKLLTENAPDNLTAAQKINRSQLIAYLKEYKEAGKFPENHSYKNEHRPVFIDRVGNICAVGFLVVQTEGLAAAQEINQTHKFDYILNIESDKLDKWIQKWGITKIEAAIIQPAYPPANPTETKINNNDIETGYAMGSSVLAGMQIGTLTYSLLASDSYTDQRRISVLNTALGLSSMTLGFVNLDNSYTEFSYPDPEMFCAGGCLYTKTTYTNESRRNLSIANIAAGGASAIINGIRFFTVDESEAPSQFSVNTTQLYDPASQSIAPGLSLNVRF